ATARAATAAVLAGRAAPSATGAVSASVAALVRGAIRAMTLSRVKVMATASLFAAVALLAVGGLVRAGLPKGEPGAAPRPTLAGGPEAGTQKGEARPLDLLVIRRSDRSPVAWAAIEASW